MKFTKKKFLKKKFTKKVYFGGKSYKLSIKSKLYNFRFNRSNKTLFLNTNLRIIPNKYRNKLYVYNLYTKKLHEKLDSNLLKIRKYNTYTLRGIYSNSLTLNKRKGRISGYM